MVFRSAQYFIRNRWSQTRRRDWAAAIAIGTSAAIFLATRNHPVDERVHADGSERSTTLRNIAKAGPPGIRQISWHTSSDTEFRSASRGHRTLLNFFEGSRIAFPDDIQQALLFLLDSKVFNRYKVEDSSAWPVEVMQDSYPSPKSIYGAIKLFIKLVDDNVMDAIAQIFTDTSASKDEVAAELLVTMSARMLSVLYEDDHRLLHIASIGNMRALLGRPRRPDRDGVVKYDVHVLSVDHTLDNPAERARMKELHPGEDIIHNGTLLGRPYTRALGDGPLKWPEELQQKLRTSHPAAAVPRVKTPPYISAEPEFTTIKVRPGDFLVMTPHWVSECLTDAEVVGLVGAWVNQHRKPRLLSILFPPMWPPRIIEPHELPVDIKEGEDKTVMFRRWNVPKLFLNVASADTPTPAQYVLLNAIGGAHLQLKDSVLTGPGELVENIKRVGVAVVLFR
ncbi:phosphatase 2C-like domain-containing protein [Mycena filopes]|nr:phosphatase 2C-like domain-containing protein [Mycena filopes]